MTNNEIVELLGRCKDYRPNKPQSWYRGDWEKIEVAVK